MDNFNADRKATWDASLALLSAYGIDPTTVMELSIYTHPFLDSYVDVRLTLTRAALKALQGAPTLTVVADES